jgi:hypothetical protein
VFGVLPGSGVAAGGGLVQPTSEQWVLDLPNDPVMASASRHPKWVGLSATGRPDLAGAAITRQTLLIGTKPDMICA